MICDYAGSHFGAAYPDACCIDGTLWDLDSCDEPGGSLYSGGDIFCPKCETQRFLDQALSEAKDGGCGESMWTPWTAMIVWEGAITCARSANPEAAEAALKNIDPFITDDWDDRKAVLDGRAPWDEVVAVEWRYAPPIPHAAGAAKRQDTDHAD